jgi:heat shock protein HtpX
MKRIFLFLATNIAVLAVLSIVMQVFGIDRMLAEQGQDYRGLLIMAAVFGFGGAFISLAMSKWMAKKSMGVYVIEQPRNSDEAWLVETVRRQAQEAGIGMPEVGVFESPDMNAFATGARRDAALVAVSTGLLRGMSQKEAEAVLGHEVSHVANGDMVTLTLIQGVLNTFVIFLSRIIGGVIDNAMSGNRERRGPGPFYFMIVMVLQILLGILASMVVAWFSRYREFRADAGGAKLSGRQNMIGALQKLQQRHAAPLPEQFVASGITGGKLSKLFASHPPLEERIEALRQAA